MIIGEFKENIKFNFRFEFVISSKKNKFIEKEIILLTKFIIDLANYQEKNIYSSLLYIISELIINVINYGKRDSIGGIEIYLLEDNKIMLNVYNDCEESNKSKYLNYITKYLLFDNEAHLQELQENNIYGSLGMITLKRDYNLNFNFNFKENKIITQAIIRIENLTAGECIYG